MHNAGYQALGANFIYVPITTNNLQDAIAGVRGYNLRGSSVAMPHKQEVMKYLDKIDSVAQSIGAVNTVANNNGVLTGYNSDWIGAMNALKEAVEPGGKKVIVIGAGGAARAIVYGLVQQGANVFIYARNTQKAAAMAQDLNAKFGGDLEALMLVADYDIVINATPVGSVGMGTTESIADDSFFKPNTVAMDVVTVPAETKFLKQAKANGAVTVPGYRMLIHQAIFQMEIYSGQKAPFEAMEKALLEAVEQL